MSDVWGGGWASCHSPLAGALRLPFAGALRSPLAGALRSPLAGALRLPLADALRLPLAGAWHGGVARRARPRPHPRGVFSPDPTMLSHRLCCVF